MGESTTSLITADQLRACALTLAAGLSDREAGRRMRRSANAVKKLRARARRRWARLSEMFPSKPDRRKESAAGGGGVVLDELAAGGGNHLEGKRE